MPSLSRTAVLSNYELLTLIFGDFLPWDPTRLARDEVVQGRKQLRDLAITCKAFKDPALAKLWTYLDSLLPLALVLPDLRVWNNGYPTTQKPVSISPHAYVLIAKLLEGQALFPGLRKVVLQTECDPATELAILPLIFPPSVETAEIHGEGFSKPMFANYCLPFLMTQFKCTLKHLSLKNDKQDVDPAVVDAIVQLTCLESLDLQLPQSNRIKPEYLMEIGKAFQKLTSLKLDVHFPSHRVSETSPHQNHDLDTSGLFPALKSLHVVSRSESQICACIPAYLVEKITSLVLMLTEPIQTTDFFASTMISLSKMRSLKKLEVFGGSTTRVAHWNAMLPLLQQLPLEEFKLDVFQSTSWTASLESLVDGAVTFRGQTSKNTTAIQPLQALTLPSSLKNSFITLDCLSTLAEEAIGLEYLAISLKPEGRSSGRKAIADLLFAWKTLKRSSCPLKRLAVSQFGSDVVFSAQEYDDLAQLLDLMFPQLTSIRPYDGEKTQPYWNKHWWFIERLRKMYKRCRLNQLPSH
ncbi:hypothetical protein H1R20_g15819, partial [Candolleomyces eurysporus]